MNTTTSETARSGTLRPSDTLRLPGRTPRTALPDRLAMRVALWLVLWGTRPARHRAGNTDPWLDHRRDVDRDGREQAWLALARHTHPY
ncbi:hypothetical protein [Microbacterium memoriense]|uniref:Uncharacterized protein n=1 Tax=Microbacterium memoriense TaxID=2978350 RepID=A0ABT2PCF1_9MICO|nr:hypothetical protein [Microbacterium memoriense]MCT9001543.1 hypothetical protein [Microbacterium memoriense]